MAVRTGQVVEQVEDVLGPESTDSSGMDLTAEFRDVVVTSDEIAGQTIGESRAKIDPQLRRGIFVSLLTRLNQPLPVGC